MRSALKYLRLEMKKKGHIKKSDGSKGKSSMREEEKVVAAGDACQFHRFTDDELQNTQTKLLEWYDANKRDLPWRRQSKVSDINQRAYGVWVSEVMLQQTQVATVIDYYKRWMKKWPTLEDLAQAKLEEVNEVWSGLGYYSRGRRLHEGAQKVVSELKGEMPKSCEELHRQLPGVGRYTAGAIASIALGQKCGVVDGNVIRVLSRLRMIGADSASPTAMDAFWDLANGLAATCERPGDLNQSLMELGATVCTPKAPQCSSCPLRQTCRAYAKVEKEKKNSAGRLVSKEATVNIPDIECLAEDCRLCLNPDDPWDSSLGVQNFPRKAKKKAARVQSASVCVVCKVCQDGQCRFLIVQRPLKGLLAGLWEFPSADAETGAERPRPPDILQQLQDGHGVLVSDVETQAFLGEVVHIFSHIHQTYLVSMVTVKEENVTMAKEDQARWVTKEELDAAALPTAMRKVFKLYSEGKGHSKGAKRKLDEVSKEDKRQRSIDSFFTPKR
ncbi:adenine DNA glycosylase-like [Babylonia areolata]|uniref:adenine DNA glycosylase-like n=1 Tax=Babylonia areolata TaxID=304850 RepID=UPI003FD29B65